jgi:hypothetical protein
MTMLHSLLRLAVLVPHLLKICYLGADWYERYGSLRDLLDHIFFTLEHLKPDRFDE